MTNIHKRLKKMYVYGNDAFDCSTVQLVGRQADYLVKLDTPRSGIPHTAQTPGNVQCIKI